jgi:hypothetical protein
MEHQRAGWASVDVEVVPGAGQSPHRMASELGFLIIFAYFPEPHWVQESETGSAEPVA